MEERTKKTISYSISLDSIDTISDIAGDMMDINHTVELILDSLESEADSLIDLVKSQFPKIAIQRHTESLFYLLRLNRKCADKLMSITDAIHQIEEQKDSCASIKGMLDCKSVWEELEKKA